MGKIGKPQRSAKHKKLKSVGAGSRGKGGHRRNEGLNQKPKSCTQEIPKKLKNLGIAIKDLKEGRLGKKSKNKYLKKPDAPRKNDNFTVKPNPPKDSKPRDENATASDSLEPNIKTGKKKMGKRKQKLTKEAVNDYIDTLKPTRPLVESFQFKQKKEESQKAFMRRVNEETEYVVKKSAIADRFDISDKKKMEMQIKKKISGGIDKKREKPGRKKRKAEARKEKRYDEFSDLQDKVEFGDVVHAPPALTVLPKKAKPVGHDRPGLRMPELKESFVKTANDVEKSLTKNVREKGQVLKRKSLSSYQQMESDLARENFIEAYRQMKIKNARLK